MQSTQSVIPVMHATIGLLMYVESLNMFGHSCMSKLLVFTTDLAKYFYYSVAKNRKASFYPIDSNFYTMTLKYLKVRYDVPRQSR